MTLQLGSADEIFDDKMASPSPHPGRKPKGLLFYGLRLVRRNNYLIAYRIDTLARANNYKSRGETSHSVQCLETSIAFEFRKRTPKADLSS